MQVSQITVVISDIPLFTVLCSNTSMSRNATLNEQLAQSLVPSFFSSGKVTELNEFHKKARQILSVI